MLSELVSTLVTMECSRSAPKSLVANSIGRLYSSDQIV